MALNKISSKRILIVSVLLNFLLAGLCVWLHRQIKVAAVFQIAPGKYMFDRDKLYKNLAVSPENVVFIGDSEILLFNLEELLPGKNILNRGIISDDTRGVDRRLPDVLKGHPAKLFVEVGANDFYSKTDSSLFYMNHIIQQTKQLSPATTLYIQSVLPQNTEHAAKVIAYNAKLRELCKAEQVDYIDLQSKFVKNGVLNPAYNGGDGLHLNEKGYLLWAEVLKGYL